MTMELQINIPKGQVIHNLSSKEIIEDLEGEFNFFISSIKYEGKVKHDKKIDEAAQGTYEFANWIIDNIENYESLLKALAPFLKYLSSWAYTKLFSKKKTKEKETPQIFIIINGKKLNLPDDKENIDEFLAEN
jgi:hypothetical protein